MFRTMTRINARQRISLSILLQSAFAQAVTRTVRHLPMCKSCRISGRRSAFSWEGEEVVINVVTWFVDQFNQALHSCWRPRPVRLQGEAQDWERQLRLAWHDLQLPGAPILIHVV